MRFESRRYDHSPLRTIAKDFRVAKITPINCKDGIFLIFVPSLSFVTRKCQTLDLTALVSVGKASDEFALFSPLFTHGSTSGENSAELIRVQGDGPVLPMGQVV